MAHNIKEHDSMLAVGTKPWHGLGVTLAEPPTSGEEALRLATLGWTVRREPLFLGSGMRAVVTGSVSRSNDGQHAAIVREDTDEILGIVGPSYTPFQNSQMAALYDPLIQDGTITIETCGSLFNGRRIWMLGRVKGDNMEIRKGDAVARYLMFAHSHDGTMAVRFGWTAIRIVCANTLSLALKDERTQVVRCLHTTNLEKNLETLRESMVQAEEVFALSAENYRLLASRGVSRVDLREYARILVDAPKLDAEWTPSQKKKIGTIVGAAVEGRGNNGSTWWDGLNGFTEYLSWNQGSSKERRMDSVWFGDSVSKNQQALDLALEMSA